MRGCEYWLGTIRFSSSRNETAVVVIWIGIEVVEIES